LYQKLKIFLVYRLQNRPILHSKGRYQFPEEDFRSNIPFRFAEINYHEDHVNNQNGYENFLGLLHYYATRKLLL